jgi:PAS domain S-box-containing protein
MGAKMSEKLLQRIKKLEHEHQRRLLLEKQLEDTNEMLESLLNKLPVGIVIIDSQTRQILDLNPQAMISFGCTPEQLIGKKCTDYICPAHEGDCPILDQGLELDRSERQIITFTGKRIPVLKTVMRDEIGGKPILLECFIDITDKKRADQEHLKREKLQAVVEMAGAVCHEFNQPLQIISGYCELLKENPKIDSESIHQIDEILKAASKMGSLTRDVMSITAYETKPYLNSKIVDIKRSSVKLNQGDKIL